MRQLNSHNCRNHVYSGDLFCVPHEWMWFSASNKLVAGVVLPHCLILNSGLHVQKVIPTTWNSHKNKHATYERVRQNNEPHTKATFLACKSCRIFPPSKRILCSLSIVNLARGTLLLSFRRKCSCFTCQYLHSTFHDRTLLKHSWMQKKNGIVTSRSTRTKSNFDAGTRGSWEETTSSTILDLGGHHLLVIRTVVVAVTIPGSSKNNTDAVGSLESQQGKSNETSAPTFGITNTPTMNPTTPPPSVPGMDNSTLDYGDDGAVLTKPTNTAKFQEDFLLALQLDESSYLGGSYPPDSYMGKALQWILEEDIFPSMK